MPASLSMNHRSLPYTGTIYEAGKFSAEASFFNNFFNNFCLFLTCNKKNNIICIVNNSACNCYSFLNESRDEQLLHKSFRNQTDLYVPGKLKLYDHLPQSKYYNVKYWQSIPVHVYNQIFPLNSVKPHLQDHPLPLIL